ncbi:MAG: hypothetical protein IV100_07605 [Myxococcales bacterium]|nr:hypothetical protein [Myxococcales bacterium]
MPVRRAVFGLVAACAFLSCGDDGGGEGAAAPEDTGAGSDAANEECVGAGCEPEPVGTCADYCAAVMSACVDANAQYTSVDQCEAWCEAAPWTLGGDGDTEGATLSCHGNYARAAGSDPGACSDAGPVSAGCGGACVAYCEAAIGLCGGDSPLYTGFAACAEACAGMTPGGAITDGTGDTLGCRLNHLLALSAGREDAKTACAAASPGGGDTCVVPSPTNDTCATARVIDTFPFADSGDTRRAAADYDTGLGCCLPPGASPSATAQCTLDGNTFGVGGPDVVYKVVANATGEFTAELTGSWPRPELLYAASDCANIASSCLAATGDLKDQEPGRLTFALTKGASAFLVVDGRYGGDAGPYTLSLKSPCLGSCDGKVCGDDGCGNVCGVCTDGRVCDAGQCIQPAPVCAPIGALACGSTVTVGNDVAGATNAIWSAGCPAYDGGSEPDYQSTPEAAWSLEPAAGTRVTLRQADATDLDLIVLRDAGAGCVAGPATCSASGYGEVAFDAGGGSYYLVVDSPFGAIASTEVTVECCAKACDGKVCGDDGCGGSCGFCAEGSVCSEDGQCICIPACDGRACGDDGCGGTCGTCDGSDTCNEDGLCVPAGSCDGLCGIFDETRPCQCDSECFTAGDCCSDVCGTCGTDYLAECPGACEGNCVDRACGDDGCGGSCGECGVDEVGVALFCSALGQCVAAQPSCVDACGGEGQDGTCYCDEDCFVYGDCCADVCEVCTADVAAGCAGCIPDCSGRECGDDGCGGSCGECSGGATCSNFVCQQDGDNCLNAVALAVGATATGDLAGAFADHTYTPGSLCFGLGDDEALGRDRVYRFVGDGAWYTVTLTTEGWDGHVWVGYGCDGLADNCLAEANVVQAAGVESLDVYLDPGQEVVIVVDEPQLPASDDNSARVYQLNVATTEPPCVPSCDAAECGDDGCGGSCGECDGQDACVSGECVCQPSCTDKVCGTDGCGGPCGNPCAGGLVCTSDGTACETPGESCGSALVVGSLPFISSGDTSELTSDVDPDSCGTAASGMPDAVYRFMPEVTGSYALSFDHTGDGHPQTVYVTTDCSAVGAACVAPAEDLYEGGQIDVTLIAGETYFLVVDGYASDVDTDAGPYTLTMSLTEARCAESGEIACGDTAIGVVGGAGGSVQSYGCGSSGLAGEEQAYRFVAEESGPVTFTLGENTAALGLTVLSGGDCSPSACLGAATGSSVTVDVVQGETYHVVVDGVAGGPFELSAICGAITPGESCLQPLVVGAVPFEVTLPAATTDDVTAGACEAAGFGEGQPDAVLYFTAPTTGTYRVTLPGYVAGTGPSYVAVTDSCDALEGAAVAECAGAQAFFYADGAPLDVVLTGGVTYAVVVDALSFESPAPRTVRVESACAPQCEGRACGDDGCGGSCGACAPGQLCEFDTGQCI